MIAPRFRDVRGCRIFVALGAMAAILGTRVANAQGVPPGEIAGLKNVVGNRIEGAVLLAGDQTLSGGAFTQGSVGTEQVSVKGTMYKTGGAGDLGTPNPLGGLPVRWQPRLQGGIGYLTARHDFHAGLRQGDELRNKSFAVEFGGGVRFWFGDHFSVAPTLEGLYGYTASEYTARSAFSATNLAELQALGLVDWKAHTWTLIPAGEVRYVFNWYRTAFKVSSTFALYYTRSFHASNPNVDVGGSSETWKNYLEVDVPLGLEIFAFEPHIGGVVSRTEIYGDIRSAFHADHVYQTHPRVVLDFRDRLWKIKWLGVGGSYLWGSDFTAWSVGVDVALNI